MHRDRFAVDDYKLKYQIDTPLTTEFEAQGVDLSGGEGQKVAIARSFYRNKAVMIMDEPSSALDPYGGVSVESGDSPDCRGQDRALYLS